MVTLCIRSCYGFRIAIPAARVFRRRGTTVVPFQNELLEGLNQADAIRRTRSSGQGHEKNAGDVVLAAALLGYVNEVGAG
jgi:hypothetical protein